MGAAAARGADHVVITNDNPRSEDPASIADEIKRGAGANATVILDRIDAIAHAVSEARENDLILVAGKGHETTQTIGETVVEQSDREIVARLLAARSARSAR